MFNNIKKIVCIKKWLWPKVKQIFVYLLLYQIFNITFLILVIFIVTGGHVCVCISKADW